MPELMDLIVRATNAIIGVISTLGMVIYMFAVVTLVHRMLMEVPFIGSWGMVSNSRRMTIVAMLVLNIVAIVLMTMYIM